MFTHDLDCTASYRTVARGFGCGFTRAYQASQRDRAGTGASDRGELGGMRPFAGASALGAPRGEQRRFRS
jgi:hypothetical protein